MNNIMMSCDLQMDNGSIRWSTSGHGTVCIENKFLLTKGSGFITREYLAAYLPICT
jgi:hypothetical protein